MVRKSKMIGQTVNGFLILDSKHKNNDTWFTVKCVNCGHVSEMGRRVVKNGTTGCENCGTQYRKRRNGKGYHGMKLYNIYMGILRRTEYDCKNDDGHERIYKARKIKMCDAWANDFTEFLKWAQESGYKDGLMIDRIDNEKGYFPNNCRWATQKEQANNRRNNKIIEYNGKSMNAAQWADYLGVPRHIIYNRLRYGWSVERTLTENIDISKRSKRKEQRNGDSI